MDFDVATELPADAGCVAMIVGGRGTGKTTLAKRILGAGALANGSVAFNATEDVRPDYHGVSEEVHAEFDVGSHAPAIARLLRRRKYGAHFRVEGCARPSACVFDGCLDGDAGWQRNLHVRELFADHKALKLRTVLTFDAVPKLSPFVRENIDVVFLAGDTITGRVGRAYEAYGSEAGFSTLDAFATALARLASRPFEFMVIDCRTGT